MPLVRKPATGWKFSVVTTHPGVVLMEEFLKPLDISQNKQAMGIHVPGTRIGEIVRGRRGITPEGLYQSWGRQTMGSTLWETFPPRT